MSVNQQEEMMMVVMMMVPNCISDQLAMERGESRLWLGKLPQIILRRKILITANQSDWFIHIFINTDYLCFIINVLSVYMPHSQGYNKSDVKSAWHVSSSLRHTGQTTTKTILADGEECTRETNYSNYVILYYHMQILADNSHNLTSKL